ncbi:MAG: Hsp20/alpha crystallin family protein, partial [Chloroflexota bacterium]|nr:Hsp20/alpha crystallin family protein [Chloroflexota bacterium]
MVPFGGASSLFGLRRDIDRLFEDAFGGGGRGPTWAPAVDVHEDNQQISLNVELPGIKPENVDISVENGVLTVRGEKREERKEGEEGRYHLVERSYGSFLRSFVLPQGVNEEQIAADFDNGLLRIRIPKAALPQPRRIQIAGGQQVSGGQQQAGGGRQQG